jgi:long-chain fatty acid transport protein
MRLHFKFALLSAMLTSLTVPFNASATNGMYLIGFGAKSRAMGGTGVAYNTGGYAASFNPATMIDSGTRFDVGAELFVPPRAIHHESTTLGYTDERSNHDIFLIPSMGGTWQWKENVVVGFAFIGAGLQTEYNQTVNSDSCRAANAANPGSCPPTVFNVGLITPPATEAGVHMLQAQMLPSIAYRVNKHNTFGATLAIAGTYFRAKGFEDFATLGFTASGSTDGLTGEGWDNSWGVGYRLGWLGKFFDDKLNVGVNYSERIDMSKFSRYKNLFAEQGDFDIPENYALGIAYMVKPELAVAFDIQRTNYSDIPSVGNPGPDASNPSSFFSLCRGLPNNDPCLLGGPLGLGFGWTDQTVYKLGVDWSYNEKWNIRGGFNYGESPIPEKEVLFNMLAPATVERHLTVGAGYKISSTMSLDMNFMYAFNNTIKGPTAFGVGGAIVTGSNASISMKQYSLGATLGMKF